VQIIGAMLLLSTGNGLGDGDATFANFGCGPSFPLTHRASKEAAVPT